MTTKNFTAQQRPVSSTNPQINAIEGDIIGTNSKQKVSSKDDVADDNSAADGQNQAEDHIVLSVQHVKVASRLWVEGICVKKG